jgi:DNA-binding IclR family transcriptional regulator
MGRARDESTKSPNAPGAKLGAQLEQIREERWTTSVGEREEGVSAAATAILDARDRVVAALSVSAPTTRLGESELANLREPLESCAAEIHALLKRG